MQLGAQLLVVLLEVLRVGDGGAVRLAEGAVLALQLVLLLGHPVVGVLQLPQLPLQPPGLLLAVVLGHRSGIINNGITSGLQTGRIEDEH